MAIYFRLKAFIAHPELQAFIHAEYHGALLSRILHAHETTEALNEAQGICSRLLGLGLVALVWLGNMALLPVSALLPFLEKFVHDLVARKSLSAAEAQRDAVRSRVEDLVQGKARYSQNSTMDAAGDRDSPGPGEEPRSPGSGGEPIWKGVRSPKSPLSPRGRKRSMWNRRVSTAAPKRRSTTAQDARRIRLFQLVLLRVPMFKFLNRKLSDIGLVVLSLTVDFPRAAAVGQAHNGTSTHGNQTRNDLIVGFDAPSTRNVRVEKFNYEINVRVYIPVRLLTTVAVFVMNAVPRTCPPEANATNAANAVNASPSGSKPR